MTPAEQPAAQDASKNTARKRVVIIGLDPSLIDFSSPDFAAFPGLNAEKVSAGIATAEEGLRALGYDAQHCLIDFGETAEAVVTAELKKRRYDCILIGAGVRDVPSNLILFEKLINIIHEQAPNSKICFNTNPSDTLAALQRWI